jgi:selenocysteine lyase/cysteine desulfurase
VGWNSVVQGNDYSRVELNLRDAAARYEGGSQNMIGFHGLGASLDLLSSLGVGPHDSPVAEQVLALTDFAAAELAACGATLLAARNAAHRSGIVTFVLPDRDPQAVRRQLEAAGIVVRCRGGGVRMSPHGYNTRSEIERMIAELRRMLSER